jgi:hypothetical protein
MLIRPTPHFREFAWGKGHASRYQLEDVTRINSTIPEAQRLRAQIEKTSDFV